MPILIVTLAVVAAGLPLLYWLRFDFNPINLRSPKTEAVATYLALKNDPESGANDIQVLEPSLAAADQMAAKLRALPEVARVVTLSSFIPADQQQKLPLIQDAAKTLLPVLNPTAVQPAADRRAECQHDEFHDRCAQPAGRQRHRRRRGCGAAAGGGDDARLPKPIRRCGSGPRRCSCSRCAPRSTICAICSRRRRSPAPICRPICRGNG